MTSTSSTLRQLASKLAANLYEFVIVIALGLLVAFLAALPWLLRMTAMLSWLFAAWFGLNAIQTIYAPYSPAIPVIALQFSVILILVGWVLVVLSKNTNFIWGGMAAGGLVMGSAAIGAIRLLAHWQHADLFFHVLPPALFAILLIYETTHLRSVLRNRNVPLEADRNIVDDATELITAQ